MMLFKSFRSLADDSKDLMKQIDSKKYLAHISDKKDGETLKEHTELVKKYALSLIEIHKLDEVVNTIISEVIKDLSRQELIGNFIKGLFIDSIVYHDLGKINPNFQAKKMKNTLCVENPNLNIKHHHSFLGTFILQNFYFKRVVEASNFSYEQKIFLYYFILIITNSINRHHSSYIDIVREFQEQDIKEILPFLGALNIELEEKISLSFYAHYEVLENTFKNEFSNFNFFSIFSLVKLNYSLLTASDYYATSEYMNNLKVTDFGIIDSQLRKRIINSFVTNTKKPYNKELIENTEKYNELSFDNLQDRNNENLNLLRQKIASEAIQNLRSKKDEYLFYLEAPTGSGKTNISIAIATELLKFDENLSKIYYVFPFTTLVDQTFKSIKDTIEITDDEIIQLHSKAGFPSKDNKEGHYGSDYKNYIDYLFVNYPISVLTHIRFFDILKGNSKETNYLLHRLANSIVIIDELQSYPPTHWDKIVYFLDNYAKLFNIKVLIMSATLPKIDELNDETKGKIVELVTNRDQYFCNPNFGKRISFEIISWTKPKSNEEKMMFLKKLTKLIFEKSEDYASINNNKVRTVIEFISKRTASDFLKELNNNSEYDGYAKYLISGEILESRRKEIIEKIKNEEDDKVIVVTTQVIEAGVDIDMDIGFKDRSLIDSEEQLAGRINREAKKKGCKLYIFDLDKTKNIYSKDYRYEIQSTDKWVDKNYLNILNQKNYKELYQRVNEKLRAENRDAFNSRSDYWKIYLPQLKYNKIDQEFKIISEDTAPMFIPLEIHKTYFNQTDLKALGIFSEVNDYVSGEKVFSRYIELVENKENNFVSKNINLKKMSGIMSQFIISVFPNQLEQIKEYTLPSEQYGYEYLINWEKVYSYENGFDMDKIKEDIFI